MKHIQKNDFTIGIKIIDFTLITLMVIYILIIIFILLPIDYHSAKIIAQIMDMVVMMGLMTSIILILKPYLPSAKDSGE